MISQRGFCRHFTPSKYFLLLILLIQINLYDVSYAQEYLSEKLDDGVIRYYHPTSDDDKPWTYRMLEKLYDITLTFSGKTAPFGKSVAFLAGVSQYDNINPDLPWVKNDIMKMREFLLKDGGFDEVYVAEGKTVSRDLLNDYMRNKFPKTLTNKDRLLFYYAGHGADNRGKIGYMQFAGAKNDNFSGDQVLALENVRKWSEETNVKHLLILLDCCASGLATTNRQDENIKVAWKLSADPSRTIVTAGTGTQNTFEVDTPDGLGNGVFTLAFLNVVRNETLGMGRDGFMTIGDIYEKMKRQITNFALSEERELTPRILPYKEANYPGTFVFINSNGNKEGVIPSQGVIDDLNGKPRGVSGKKDTGAVEDNFKSLLAQNRTWRKFQFSGRVFDSSTHLPLRNLTINIPQLSAEGVLYQDTTSENGKYNFELNVENLRQRAGKFYLMIPRTSRFHRYSAYSKFIELEDRDVEKGMIIQDIYLNRHSPHWMTLSIPGLHPILRGDPIRGSILGYGIIIANFGFIMSNGGPKKVEHKILISFGFSTLTSIIDYVFWRHKTKPQFRN